METTTTQPRDTLPPGGDTTWLTRQQAADRAHISTRTVDRMLRDGTLTRHTVTGRRRVLIDAAELARHITNRGQS